MGFKDIRAMTAISDSLEDLHCKLYGYLESASIFFAKCYSKSELEMAEIFARSITDEIYIRPELRPEPHIILCIELKTDDFLKLSISKPMDMNIILKGDRNEKVHSEGSSDSGLHVDTSGEKRTAGEAEAPKVK